MQNLTALYKNTTMTDIDSWIITLCADKNHYCLEGENLNNKHKNMAASLKE